MSRRLLVLSLVCLLAVPLAGCRRTSPGGGATGATGASTGAPGETATPATGTQPGGQQTATMSVSVYFSVEGEGIRGGEKVAGERLVKTSRVVPKSDTPLTFAIAAWLAGPTPAEKAAGRWLAAPAGLVPNSIAVADGVATIDLPKAFEPKGGSAAVMNVLGQLVYTATSVRGVKSVLLKLDGKTDTDFGSEGVDVSKPLKRAEVEDYFIK